MFMFCVVLIFTHWDILWESSKIWLPKYYKKINLFYLKHNWISLCLGGTRPTEQLVAELWTSVIVTIPFVRKQFPQPSAGVGLLVCWRHAPDILVSNTTSSSVAVQICAAKWRNATADTLCAIYEDAGFAGVLSECGPTSV